MSVALYGSIISLCIYDMYVRRLHLMAPRCRTAVSCLTTTSTDPLGLPHFRSIRPAQPMNGGGVASVGADQKGNTYLLFFSGKPKENRYTMMLCLSFFVLIGTATGPGGLSIISMDEQYSWRMMESFKLNSDEWDSGFNEFKAASLEWLECWCS